jgi:hypothetical protein
VEHEVCSLPVSDPLIDIVGFEVDILARNPSVVKNGYTTDSIWRNRDTFLRGHDEIVEFLTKKWSVENGYRLRKELFAFTDNKVCHELHISPQKLNLSGCIGWVSRGSSKEILRGFGLRLEA